jgi:hypothetical protein
MQDFKYMHLKTHGYAYKRNRYVGICIHEGQIPMAALSRAWVFGRSLAGIGGSNPPGVWMSVCRILCIVR